MTVSSRALNTVLALINEELPRPDAVAAQQASGPRGNTSLPRPTGSKPNVTDAGRIKFGAGYRLPTSK